MGRMAAGPARGDLLGPYVALGAVAGLSVLGFGVVPRSLAGVVSLVAVVAVTLIDRLWLRSAWRRPRGAELAHLIAAGVVCAGSLLLVTTVLHAVWWAGLVLACLVFCAISVGARFHGARRAPASDAG